MKERKYGLDITRSIALYFVVMVHSFINSSFNYSNVVGIKMFSLLFLRCLSFCGVLLFILLTGYLNNKKVLNKKYYKSLLKVLIIYFIISVIVLLYRKLIISDTETWYNLIIGVFNFTTLPYAWYVEMYFGLFLIIPFLNILYNNIDSKRNKQIMLLTLFIITSLFPTISLLKVDGHSLDIVPNWWGNLYPVFIYFVGAYINEYKIKLNNLINISIIFVLLFLQTFILYFYLQGSYVSSIPIPENSVLPVITAVLIFILLYDIKAYNKVLIKTVGFISTASFGAYLFSYLFDKVVYSSLSFLDSKSSFYYYICVFLVTPVIVLLSTIASYCINIVYSFFSKLIGNYRNKRLIKIEQLVK